MPPPCCAGLPGGGRKEGCGLHRKGRFSRWRCRRFRAKIGSEGAVAAAAHARTHAVVVEPLPPPPPPPWLPRRRHQPPLPRWTSRTPRSTFATCSSWTGCPVSLGSVPSPSVGEEKRWLCRVPRGGEGAALTLTRSPGLGLRELQLPRPGSPYTQSPSRALAVVAGTGRQLMLGSECVRADSRLLLIHCGLSLRYNLMEYLSLWATDCCPTLLILGNKQLCSNHQSFPGIVLRCCSNRHSTFIILGVLIFDVQNIFKSTRCQSCLL